MKGEPNNDRIPRKKLLIDKRIGREIFIGLLHPARSKISRFLPEYPAIGGVPIVDVKEGIQPLRIGIDPVRGQDHSGRGQSAALLTHGVDRGAE